MGFWLTAIECMKSDFPHGSKGLRVSEDRYAADHGQENQLHQQAGYINADFLPPTTFSVSRRTIHIGEFSRKRLGSSPGLHGANLLVNRELDTHWRYDHLQDPVSIS